MIQRSALSHSGDPAQGAVEYLFRVTGMPAVLTDQHFTVLASSVHPTADPNRRRAILERRTPAPSRHFVQNLHGGLHLHGGLRRRCTSIPAQPAIGMELERWCVPVFDDQTSLYFWLLRDADSDCDMAEVTAAALDAERVLARRQPTRSADQELVWQCVEDLFDADPVTREFAVRRLRAANYAVPEDGDVVVVLDDAGSRKPLGVSLSLLCETVERLDLPDGTLVGTQPSAAVVLSHSSSRAALRRALRQVPGLTVGRRLTAGVVPLSPGEDKFAALRRATLMAYVARLPDCPDVMEWENAGPWAALAGVPLGWDSVDQFSPGSKALVRDNPVLAETALAYLESSNVDATAELLTIHRTTLYYRLKQVERYLGEGWSTGWQRAGTHASLQLGRLLTAAGDAGHL